MQTRTILPTLFREALEDIGMVAIDEWWAFLDEEARSQALLLWDDCSQSGHGLRIAIEAEFSDEEEDVDRGFWHSDYYDYLVNHEVYLFNVPGVHICTRHPQAAGAVRRGLIPGAFSCPFETAECPMERLRCMSAGRPVRLVVRLVKGRQCCIGVIEGFRG